MHRNSPSLKADHENIVAHSTFDIPPDEDVEPKKGKILAVEFIGGKSHVITYLALLEEMARRGYEYFSL